MAPASSNWHALQKTLDSGPHSKMKFARKRRKLEAASSMENEEQDFPRYTTEHGPSRRHQSDSDTEQDGHVYDHEDSSSAPSLCKMVLGKIQFHDTHQIPGKYIAIDCEMVGIGLEGLESSLARVSIVNYYGFVLMDEIVKQRERVIDYRTQWSGIRVGDMNRAIPFDDVQKKVSELLNTRILIGHALHNDLKALLLSHPRPQTRDTQLYAQKYKLTKSKYIALRNLVKQELNMAIQEGEHSSVIDARATMAIFRLHKNEWEKGTEVLHARSERRKTNKRKRKDGEDSQEEVFPGGGRRGISSGLSTVTKIRKKGEGDAEWWKSF